MGYLISSFGRVLDFESVQFLIGLNWLFLHFPSFPFKNITCLNKHLEYCTGIYQSTKIFAFTGILGIYIRLNYFKCFAPLRTIKKHTVQFKVIPFMFFFQIKICIVLLCWEIYWMKYAAKKEHFFTYHQRYVTRMFYIFFKGLLLLMSMQSGWCIYR